MANTSRFHPPGSIALLNFNYLAMFTALLSFLLIFAAADGLLSAAIVYHIQKYSLPDWRAMKIVMPIYFGLFALFLALALYSLTRIKQILTY